MATFNLNHHRNELWRRRRHRAGDPAGETGESVLVSWLLTAVMCLALAAPCPPAALPWVAAGLFSLSGFAWLGLALTRGVPPAAAPTLTPWDAALLSFAASFGVQAAARLGLLGA
ncbi:MULTISPECIES: hypothetical protein [unclassified Methylobacterium]|jgi:hypothetical protein|uniref:hypothetical protein n=1 Tax=unclassified Methylobacterium TaxID=2615210 RepID=UPI0013521F6F|nr:hypothetical protein [Methylobacterium sp. 2A]MWV23304.1 hypothetical protein [Methylobacterium sp. 2A]